MTIAIPGTITGASQTGFTSPTYTATVDGTVESNGKQVAITGLGGTQTGVDTHSVSRPFTVAVYRPKQFQALGKPSPTTGLIANVPMNVYKIVARKGVTPLSGQPSVVAMVNADIRIPAGADTADIANIRALLSATIGTLTAISAGLGDTVINGVM